MGTPASTDVLDFWFADRTRPLWFNGNASFDAEIRDRFGGAVDAALAGELGEWESTAGGALALVILLDQFPRNIFRGTPRAFAGDARATRVASAAIARGFDQALPLERQMFLYMPFQHSEDRSVQDRSVELFTRWAEAHQGPGRKDAEENLAYAHRHHEIVHRFGRFPHRNVVLGRESTSEEIAFLKEPGSSF